MRTAAGVTLPEVMVALVLAAMSVSLAALLLGAVSGGLERTRERGVAHQRQMTAWRWLEEALMEARTAPRDTGWFLGQSDSMTMETRAWQASGWKEPRVVSFIVRDGELLMRVGNDRSAVLLDSLTSTAFDYLASRGTNAAWLRAWESDIALPLAVRARVARGTQSVDTLIFFIGDRR